MQDNLYTAEEIMEDIQEGNKDDAINHLNHDYLQLQKDPERFKQLVLDMEELSKKNDGLFSSGGDNIYHTENSKGEVVTVSIDDSSIPYFDSEIFDAKDYKGNVTDPFRALKRGLGGALDGGKKKQ
jgi:hypothetical protein